MTSRADLPTPKNELVKCVRLLSVVGVWMNRAPPLPRSGGVGARYWEGGGWVGMTKKKKRNEN